MKLRKKLALGLVAIMMISILAACGGNSNGTEGNSVDGAGTGVSYQFCGNFEDADDPAFAAFLNAAFLLNLNEDGTAVCDKYKTASYDGSDAASNENYTEGFLSGTWEETEKDGVECLQIKLSAFDSDGNEADSQTLFAYDVAGEYKVEMTFPIYPGLPYSRQVDMVGKAGVTYEDDNAFIQAYKLEFVAPENVGTFVDEENGGTVYLQADGKALFYAEYNQFLEGTWAKTADGISITVDGTALDVTMDGNKATFAYSRDMNGQYTTDYTFVCEDVTVLP